MMLTNKQEAFVQELIKGKSQREAHRIAYPRSVNWKDETVDQTACRLLKNPKVLARFNELKGRLIKEAEDECIFDAKMWLTEVVAIVSVDVTDIARVETRERKRQVWDDDLQEYVMCDETNQMDQFVLVKDTDELTIAQRKAIKSIKQGKYGVEIELYPKDKSLEMLGKHLKMFTDKVEVKDVTERVNPIKELTTEELKQALGLI